MHEKDECIKEPPLGDYRPGWRRNRSMVDDWRRWHPMAMAGTEAMMTIVGMMAMMAVSGFHMTIMEMMAVVAMMATLTMIAMRTVMAFATWQ